MEKTNRNGQNKWVYLTLLPVLMWMVVIFLLSAQPGEVSSGTSGRVVRLLLQLMYPGFDNLTGGVQHALIESFQFLARKTAHVTEYAILGFLVALHLNVRQMVYERPTRILGSAWMVGTGYAVTDEVHQWLTGSRSGQWTDVLLDSVGVMAGVLVCIGVWKLVQHRKRKKKKI